MTMDSLVAITLDAEARLELASMVYSRWCAAFDNLKVAKTQTWESTGKFCPKAEWPNYHGSIIENAQVEFDLAARLKTAICPYSPLMRQE